ncbi:carboxypeptidase-like regulatory domain-containing protein [Burkholderia sp. GbtcB21]|uniref:carboxypeptidase-like regulatory domain-containing protein n=1 Tax=Burkholderia sp. GbtcB21 TaxID=2824766 RepID=UPI001C303C74|nr:carboxypeptidase-like regulatory domain-containing protein [Burkholderia sp. GbtcB21]
MQKFQDAVLMTNGQPAANVQVTVLNYPSLTAPTIYSDNGVTQYPSNVLTTDSLGNFSFYAPNGHYQLTVSGAGIQTAIRSDIILLDMLPADLSTTLPGTPGQPWNNGGSISIS